MVRWEEAEGGPPGILPATVSRHIMPQWLKQHFLLLGHWSSVEHLVVSLLQGIFVSGNCILGHWLTLGTRREGERERISHQLISLGPFRELLVLCCVFMMVCVPVSYGVRWCVYTSVIVCVTVYVMMCMMVCICDGVCA